MSAPRHRAVRFADPAVVQGGGRGGLGLTHAGALAMVEGDDSIRQAILLLLLTMPGERVMRPDYGSHLHRLAFAPNDATTAGLAIHYVRDAIARWEPRVEIVDLDARADLEDPALLVVELRYRVRATAATGLLELAVDLGGGPVEELRPTSSEAVSP